MRTVTLNICAIAFVCGTNLSAEDGKPITSTNSIGIEFIEVREGTYQMGSPASEEGRKDNENPVRVSITVGYWLGKTEVTQGQWKQVMETQPWADQKGVGHGDDYPAACLSWDDCMAFCEKLTQRERESGSLSAEERYRLPTEAEWEYACRAGSTTMFSFGNDGSNLKEHAFFEENAPQHALEVGKKNQILGDFVTCMEMSSNGVRIVLEHLRGRRSSWAKQWCIPGVQRRQLERHASHLPIGTSLQYDSIGSL